MTDNLIRPAFTSTKLEEERDQNVKIITVKLNQEEQEWLKQARQIIRQPKESTALKQLALGGVKVLLGDLKDYFIDVSLNNERKNQRIGRVDFD